MSKQGRSSGDEDAVRRGAAVARLLERHGVSVSGRVLDIGCGEGGAASAMRGSVVAIDAALHLLRRGRIARPGVTFVGGDAGSLPFRDSSFEGVVLFDVLEHVRDWPAVILESARVLRPGGAVFVTAANTRSPITVLDDPHWHFPLVAILPPGPSAALVRLFGGGSLDMAGIYPVFPSWSQLSAAFGKAGLRPKLISNMEKVTDPASIVDPTRRRIGQMLNSWGVSRGHARFMLEPLIRLYDRVLARSWTFIAFKAPPPAP